MITLLVWLLSFLRVAQAWSDLPATMASHYGPTGVPDGWMAKAAFLGTMLTMNTAIIGLLSAAPLTLRAIPDGLINLPNREYWLTSERRGETHARLSAHLSWFGCLTAAFMTFALELALRANLRAEPLDHAALMIGLGVYVVAAFAFAVLLYRAFRIPE